MPSQSIIADIIELLLHVRVGIQVCVTVMLSSQCLVFLFYIFRSTNLLVYTTTPYARLVICDKPCVDKTI